MKDKNKDKLHLPSHALLRSFECAARHQSFTKAAEELHISQSAISRQVSDLEHMINVKLFRRAGRKVVLTNAGYDLAQEIRLDLKQIEQTLLRAVAAGNKRSAIRLATLPTFGERWLIPRLSKFEKAYPDIEVSMATRLEPFDLTKERFDLAIHYGMIDWPDTHMSKLCDENIVAVASPKFLERYPIDNVVDIEDIPLLHLESRFNAWPSWFHDRLGESEKSYAGKIFDQFSMVISAALNGLGAALIPEYLIQNELANGYLVCLDDGEFLSPNSYFIVTPKGAVNPQAKIFERWIKSMV